MSNPPKQKGTGGEREVARLAEDAYGLNMRRAPAGSNWDVEVIGSTGRTIEALATRPDRGKWLVTIPLADLFHLLALHGDNAHIEVKRFRRFAHHSIYEGKFGRKEAT